MSMDQPHLPAEIPESARAEAKGILESMTDNPRISRATVDGVAVYVDIAILQSGIVSSPAERIAAAEIAAHDAAFEGVDKDDEAAQLRASQQALASTALGGSIVRQVIAEEG